MWVGRHTETLLLNLEVEEKSKGNLLISFELSDPGETVSTW